MSRPTLVEAYERLTRLEDLVKSQQLRIAELSAKTATQSQVRAAFAATHSLRREAMAAARAEAMRTGKSVKVELA